MEPVTIDTVAQALHAAHHTREVMFVDAKSIEAQSAARIAWGSLGQPELDAWRAAAREAVRLHKGGYLALVGR